MQRLLNKEYLVTLRKHAYSNILKMLPPKTENFQIKNSDIFHISAQNIDCGYLLEPPLQGDSNVYPQSMCGYLLELPWQGGSNMYPQSMFLSRNKKNNEYPCKPQFYCIKAGFKVGSKLYRHVSHSGIIFLISQ